MGSGCSSDAARSVLSMVSFKKNKVQEVFDFDLQDPELAEAASTIQAAFRGHKAKKEGKLPPKDPPPKKKDEKMSQPQEEIDIDLNDPEVAQAATKIQASFRGHKTRKQMETTQAKPAEGELTEEGAKEEASGENVTKGDDSDLDRAATIIQAQYRGHKVRRNASKSEDE